MNQQSQRGFTLIELLLVMVIISIIMGMGVLILPGAAKSSQIRVGARQVYSTLSIARQMAIAQRIQARVVVSNMVYSGAITNAYVLMTNGFNRDANFSMAGRWESLPAGVVFTNDPGDYIQFEPTGQATVTPTLMMLLSANSNNTASISVDQLLGRITYDQFQ